MRGIKAKTLRSVAKKSKLPAQTNYGVTSAGVRVMHPCRRQMVQRMKRVCPKNSFFGVSLSFFRGKDLKSVPGMENMTITPIPAPQ